MALDRQFHPQAKALVARCSQWTRLHTAPMRVDALIEAGEAAAAPGFRDLQLPPPWSIINHLGTDSAIFMGESDGAATRATVPDHVSHSLAHSPGEHCICGRLQLPGRVFNLPCDPARGEDLPGTVQFALKPGLPVSCNGLAHLAQGMAGSALDLANLLDCARRLLLDETPCQFALERNHGQGMPEQIMEIAR